MIMRNDPKTLRDEASRARRISKEFLDPESAANMIRYADDCEKRADEIDAASVPYEQELGHEPNPDNA